MELHKEAQFVSEILQKTQAGDLNWQRSDPPQSLWVGTENKIFDFYSTKIGPKTLGVYELRTRHYDGDRDSYYWGSNIDMAIFDIQMNHQYTFRVGSAVLDLFAEVKRQTAGVDDFIDSVLSEKKAPL